MAMLLLGGLASVAAVTLGEIDVLWLTLTLALMPVMSATYLLAARPRISHVRSMEPPMIPVGDSARIVLRVVNDSPAQASALRFSDASDESLGGGATFVIARGFGRWHQAVGYSITADRRGHYLIGPLSARATDPLGLATRRLVSAGSDSRLRVTPRVWDLAELPFGAGLGAAGGSTSQRVGQAGSDDVVVREHRNGDDMRRVHWKLSAKKDELMVRLEEHPWDPSSTLIVDTRLSAHADHGPDGSLEWAVSAITSLAMALLQGRFRLSIVAPSGKVYSSGHASGPLAQRQLLESMTDLPTSELQWLGEAFHDPAEIASAASIVAVTGLLTAADAAALSAAGAKARSRIILVPDTQEWGTPSPQHDDACRLLTSTGWKVTPYGPDHCVPDAWGLVSR